MESYCFKVKLFGRIKVNPEDFIDIVVYKSWETVERFLEDIKNGKFFVKRGSEPSFWYISAALLAVFLGAF